MRWRFGYLSETVNYYVNRHYSSLRDYGYWEEELWYFPKFCRVDVSDLLTVAKEYGIEVGTKTAKELCHEVLCAIGGKFESMACEGLIDVGYNRSLLVVLPKFIHDGKKYRHTLRKNTEVVLYCGILQETKGY